MIRLIIAIRRKGMKNIASVVIFLLIVCLVVWLPAKQQKTQLKVMPQQSVLKSQVDDLQVKVNQLQRELELLKRVIRISGPNVDILSNGNVKIRATNISVEARIESQLKGMKVTVQSSGPNTIRGQPVLIN
jgi:uncharacterized membrane protein